MIDDSKSPTPKRQLSFAKSMAWVTLALTVVALVSGYFAHRFSGPWGIGSVALAWGIAIACSAAALYLTSLAKPNVQSIQLLLGAHGIRLFVSMFVVFALMLNGGPLVEAKAPYWILGFYLLGLALETSLAVRMVQDSNVQGSNSSVEQSS